MHINSQSCEAAQWKDVCCLLLMLLFFYIFWVFLIFICFRENVRVTIANEFILPGLQLISKKIDLQVRHIVPRNLLASRIVPGSTSDDNIMLGLGNMVSYLYHNFHPCRLVFCDSCSTTDPYMISYTHPLILLKL